MKNVLKFLGGVLLIVLLSLAGAWITALAINVLLLPIIFAMTGVQLVAITLGQSFALTVVLACFKSLSTADDKNEQTGAEMFIATVLKFVIFAIIILVLIAIASLFV